MQDYITTYTKKHFTIMEPKMADIDINDIAHALSLMTRANGHLSQFYSVGQHSVGCAYEALERGYSARVVLGCLLHDGSEAYMADITRPLKQHMSAYLVAEEKLQNMIFEKFLGQCPSEEEMAQIKSVDDAMLFHEFKCFMNEELDIPEHEILTRPAFSTKPFEDVEEDFLLMFHKISALL